ncbi:MAG: hypothetical protein ACD_9C00281G0003 [uncultured bacterium]|nr:MAG: hypothetical protein ACD_9C00281G0003 [uncultured bacterium]
MLNLKFKIISIILLLSFLISIAGFAFAQEVPDSSNESELTQNQDAEMHQQFILYQKYEKKKKYKKYSKAKEKYAFKDTKTRLQYKKSYENYKLFKKNPIQYRQYAVLIKEYKKYKNYKEEYAPVKKYSKYKKYNKKEYDQYKNFGSSAYQAAYNRYEQKLRELAMTYGEADLGCGVNETPSGPCLGPLISVGLWSDSKSGIQDEPFKIKADMPYNIKDKNGTILNTKPIVAIPGDDGTTEVSYVPDSGGTLSISNTSLALTTTSPTEVSFVAADGNTNIVFDVSRPGSSFDRYRYSMKVRYSDYSKQIWAINILPMEHYVWGMGEITGTGDSKYNQVMTTSFRTYGYWKLKFSKKYATEGFQVNATPGNQLYYGYDWEAGNSNGVAAHPRIKEAALATPAMLMMYLKSINEIAITPYSSWTDGRTRSFEERWGSTLYPWCKSVADPYGKHPSYSTAQLESSGNHMVGLSANGALKLARDYGWSYQEIMSYYYSGVNYKKAY